MTELVGFQAQLTILNNAYAAQLPDKIKQIEQAWSHLPLGEWHEEGFQALYRMVHSLTGSGKIFGFSVLSQVARNLEEYLNHFVQIKMPPDAEQRNQIQALLNELRLAQAKR